MREDVFDRVTLFLVSNGDVPAVGNQRLYEYAWGEGIRPINEEDLKPEFLTRKKRRGPRMMAA